MQFKYIATIFASLAFTGVLADPIAKPVAAPEAVAEPAAEHQLEARAEAANQGETAAQSYGYGRYGRPYYRRRQPYYRRRRGYQPRRRRYRYDDYPDYNNCNQGNDCDDCNGQYVPNLGYSACTTNWQYLCPCTDYDYDDYDWN